MVTRIGIIPAAGKADRFGGTIKELLPIDKDHALIDYSIMAMERGGCDPIICVTSTRKIAALAEYSPRLLCTIQTATRDIWGAIVAGLAVEADEYCFAMPDTVIPDDAFARREMDCDFMLGCFETDQPERFGMVRDHGIVNKMKGDPGIAWGVLMWNRKVRDYWLNYDYDMKSYTEAFNLVRKVYKSNTFMMSDYTDISNFEDYKRVICESPPV